MGQLKWGWVLLESEEGGGFQIVSSVFFKKSMFSLLLEYFFCLVNIDTFCNQQIYSFMWFTFYQKRIYYGIFFPLTLIFNYNFVKSLLLMTFISISISLKLQIFLKINHRYLKEVIAQLLYIMIFITMNVKFELNSAKISHKIKKLLSRKNTNQIDKSLRIIQLGAFIYYVITYSQILDSAVPAF